jgi:hypothetical protein
VGNGALVSQLVADPLGTGSNTSFISQFGGQNQATVGQTGIQSMIGANTQATMQVGYGNSATISQTAGSVSNTAVTSQFGRGNTAVVAQK